MFEVETLILKLFAVDGFATSSIASCEVAALDHEAFDDAMKTGSFNGSALASTVSSCRLTFVGEGFARLSLAFFSGAKSAKVLRGLWGDW